MNSNLCEMLGPKEFLEKVVKEKGNFSAKTDLSSSASHDDQAPASTKYNHSDLVRIFHNMKEYENPIYKIRMNAGVKSGGA